MVDESQERKRVALPPWNMNHEVVDLSVPVAEDLPCYWPTHQPYQQKVWNWYETRRDEVMPVYRRNGPYATRWLVIDEHTGTHLDAPTHFIPPEGSGLPNAGQSGSVSVDKVPLSQLIGPAAVIDVSDLMGTVEEPAVSPLVTTEKILAWEAEHGALVSGDVVLLRSGWDKYYQRGAAGAAYVHDVVITGIGQAWPAPDVAAMELFVVRGVRCIGIDAPSIGPTQGDLPIDVHIAGFSSGAVFVEGLTALDALPARGAWFCFLPIKVEGGTGAPGRAIAWVPRDREHRHRMSLGEVPTVDRKHSAGDEGSLV
jgi:kynurenine formamidase